MDSDLWTEREIEKGIAYRTEPSGSVCCFEICHGCHRSFCRGMGKLGYSTGYGLCASCYGIDKLDNKKSLADFILEVLGDQGLSKKGILDATKASWRDTDSALRLLSGRGQIELKGSTWRRVAHASA